MIKQLAILDRVLNETGDGPVIFRCSAVKLRINASVEKLQVKRCLGVGAKGGTDLELRLDKLGVTHVTSRCRSSS